MLVAYKNAGGDIDLEQALERMMAEGLKMPGAMCGLWGICGAITSIGAALAIIDGTGPLSTDGTWGNHMQFTSKAIGELGTINGPRCCKRDAMIAFKNGIDYVNAHYGVTLQYEQMQCGFTDFNEQCIKERCPFIGRPFDDNWGLEDPTGKSDEEFKIVIEQIKHDILELKSRLNCNEI